MWPINHTARMPMLDRIDVNIVNMRRIVALITNQVFPISALPDATLTFRNSALAVIFYMRLFA